MKLHQVVSLQGVREKSAVRGMIVAGRQIAGAVAQGDGIGWFQRRGRSSIDEAIR
jgi:hypothetical protein